MLHDIDNNDTYCDNCNSDNYSDNCNSDNCNSDSDSDIDKNDTFYNIYSEIYCGSDNDLVDYSDIYFSDEPTILKTIKELAIVIKRRDYEQKKYGTEERKQWLGVLLVKTNHMYAEEFNLMAEMMVFEDLPPKCEQWFKDTIFALCDNPQAVITEFPSGEWKPGCCIRR
jgi:hypothetical protein